MPTGSARAFDATALRARAANAHQLAAERTTGAVGPHPGVVGCDAKASGPVTRIESLDCDAYEGFPVVRAQAVKSGQNAPAAEPADHLCKGLADGLPPVALQVLLRSRRKWSAAALRTIRWNHAVACSSQRRNFTFWRALK